MVEVVHSIWSLGNGGVAFTFRWPLASKEVRLKSRLLVCKCQRRLHRGLMRVIVILHNVKGTDGYRAKVTIALIHDWGRTVNVLETVDSESIIGISNERTVLANSLYVITSGCFVVMIDWSGSNRGSDMTTTQQRDG